MSLRIHAGCGTVYLRGYQNIDLPDSLASIAEYAPDLVERYITDESDYYGRHKNVSEDSVVDGSNHEPGVVDAYGSLQMMPFATGEADEVLIRQVFEHLSITEAKSALRECWRVLKVGGTLRIDVPDHEKSMELYRETGRQFFKRHVLGSRKNAYAYHVMGWTKDGLVAFCDDNGFRLVEWEENIHFYPAFCGRFRRVQ